MDVERGMRVTVKLPGREPRYGVIHGFSAKDGIVRVIHDGTKTPVNVSERFLSPCSDAFCQQSSNAKLGPYSEYFITDADGKRTRICDWLNKTMINNNKTYRDVFNGLKSGGAAVKAHGNVHNWRNGTARIPPEHIGLICGILGLTKNETKHIVGEVLRAYYPTIAEYI